MKCEKCPALMSEGYEYPEYYCGLGVQDDELTEFKGGESGCRRRSLDKIIQDLKIQRKIEAEAFAEYARDFVQFMEKEAVQ